jgi:hypothetical protein
MKKASAGSAAAVTVLVLVLFGCRDLASGKVSWVA